jgi:hypothetical protein
MYRQLRVSLNVPPAGKISGGLCRICTMELLWGSGTGAGLGNQALDVEVFMEDDTGVRTGTPTGPGS